MFTTLLRMMKEGIDWLDLIFLSIIIINGGGSPGIQKHRLYAHPEGGFFQTGNLHQLSDHWILLRCG